MAVVDRPQARRRRLLAAGLLGMTLAGISVPMAAADSGDGSSEKIITCESGVVVQGDVMTSSAVAVRAHAATPVPEGCRAS